MIRVDVKTSLFLLVLALCFCAVPAMATMIVLSTEVSDGVAPPNVDFLDATLTFEVINGVLELTVANNTHLNEGNEFSIDSIYFNAPDELDDVDGLDLTRVDGGQFGQWNSGTMYSEDGYNVNSFARFDMQITNSGQHVIDPGETFIFTFAINGPGTYTGASFSSLLSINEPGEGGDPMFAAAHFVQGPGDNSAYGATNVPEPTTIALLALGGLWFRKRKA